MEAKVICELLKNASKTLMIGDTGMLEAGGQGGQLPSQILAAQKAPPAAAAARRARRLSTCPPRFLDFATCLGDMKNNIY